MAFSTGLIIVTSLFCGFLIGVGVGVGAVDSGLTDGVIVAVGVCRMEFIPFTAGVAVEVAFGVVVSVGTVCFVSTTVSPAKGRVSPMVVCIVVVSSSPSKVRVMGVSSVHDPPVQYHVFKSLVRMDASGKIQLRVLFMNIVHGDAPGSEADTMVPLSVLSAPYTGSTCVAMGMVAPVVTAS